MRHVASVAAVKNKEMKTSIIPTDLSWKEGETTHFII